MHHLFAKPATLLAAAALLGVCSSMIPFNKIDGSDPAALSKMNGSRTVIDTGGTKVEGMNPPASIVFDTGGRGRGTRRPAAG